MGDIFIYKNINRFYCLRGKYYFFIFSQQIKKFIEVDKNYFYKGEKQFKNKSYHFAKHIKKGLY